MGETRYLYLSKYRNNRTLDGQSCLVIKDLGVMDGNTRKSLMVRFSSGQELAVFDEELIPLTSEARKAGLE